MLRTAPISLRYQPVGEPDSRINDQHIFKIIDYDLNASSSASDHFNIALQPLGPTRLSEIWLSPEPLTHTTLAGIDLTMNRQVVFGHLILNEVTGCDLQEVSFSAYQKIYAAIQEAGYTNLIRSWNIFPRINQQDDSLERYQSFCIGRANATTEARQLSDQLPAASAIGSQQGAVVIYFIAARQPGVQVENPIQTSAFQYPPCYSPKSPSFSRAMFKKWDDTVQLYISGTASVLGHQTMHQGDVQQQFAQTLQNLRALTDTSNLPHKINGALDLSNIDWKLYIRQPEHYALLKDLVDRHLQPVRPVLYLQADICRTDLLMEIEGFYSK